MFKALNLSLNQLGDPAILKVLAKSLLISLVLCGLVGWAAGIAGQWYLERQVDVSLEGPYYAALAGAARAVAFLFVVFFGFRVIAIPVIGFFADEVVAAVEHKHYPAKARSAHRVGAGLSLRLGLMSTLRMILFNLLALPLYVLLLVTAVGPIALFLLVNAVLLGRDLGEMVAVRHLDRQTSAQWLRTSRGQRLLLGLAGTALFMVPLVNILAPIVGAAMATHLFHRNNSTNTRWEFE